MAWQTVLDRKNWPAGTHSFGPYAVPVGHKVAMMRMARFERQGNGKKKPNSEWEDVRDAQDVQQDVIKLVVDLSFDGGTTWGEKTALTAAGGIIHESSGDELEYTTLQTTVTRESDNPNRRIRGRIETFTTIGTIIEVDSAVEPPPPTGP